MAIDKVGNPIRRTQVKKGFKGAESRFSCRHGRCQSGSQQQLIDGKRMPLGPTREGTLAEIRGWRC